MVSSKMAASVLQRCLTAAVKVKRINPTFTARRCLLSAAYTDATLWEAQEKDPQNLALLANSMDKTYDRKFPVSSLTVSRFVDNISSREEIDQAEYYLYKFRHSPNCWYLRDWTVHSWIRQCLKYDARDKALHTLKNKVQYGIFPDDFSFNLLLDSYIKDEDFKSACAVVEEVMLQEAFDLRTTQVLSLYALSSHLATQPQLTVSEERSLGAALLIAGMKLEDTTLGLSAQLLGNALIGKMEMLQGIHAVFRDLPLLWTRGYLGRALAVMERVVAAPDLRLSKDMLDHVDGLIQDLSPTLDSDSSGGDSSGGEEEEEEEKKEEEAAKLDEDDMEETAKLPHYTSRFKELLGQLEAQGKVEPSSLRTLASGLARSSLAGAEGPDLEQYRSRVQAWEAERVQLVQREKETKEVVERERAQRLAIRAARERQRDVSTQGQRDRPTQGQRDRPTQGQGSAYGRHVRH